MKQSVKTPLFWSPAVADRQVKNADVWNRSKEVNRLSMSSVLLTVCVEAFCQAKGCQSPSNVRAGYSGFGLN